MTSWSVDAARKLYSVRHWSEGYYDVADDGRMVALPRRESAPAIALDDVTQQAQALGLRLPLLVRFTDILIDKLARMTAAFDQAQADYDYQGGYTAVYPIKVNQQRDIVSRLVADGGPRLGLEAGSKPELIAVLAMAERGIVICNGYKDREYIRLALIGRLLGLDVIIVLEKAGELQLVLEEASRLGVSPALGVRVRLASIGQGKWQNTGGDKGKFGLLPQQILDVVATLRDAGQLAALRLLHFHMGSQLSNVRDIQTGLREACRYFAELHRLGAPIGLIDVGGGLAVDYEGTRSRSFCSMNYGLEQYAATVVATVKDCCDEHGLPHPHLVTEAGRAMTAHHAVLISNITAVEPVPVGSTEGAATSQPGPGSPIRHLRELAEELADRSPLEAYQEAQHFLAEGQQRFALGQLSLDERAELDALYYAIVHGLRRRLNEDNRAHRQILDELNEKLVDKYFANFSVFQSMPDVWAIDQIFPIAPLSRMEQQPTRRALLEDLTCDSDGRIDVYVDNEGLEPSLPLHEIAPGERYLIGVFMVGAYQETLGDIHNLFGDTDSVNVHWDGSRYTFSRARHGDSTDRLLGYVGYATGEIKAAFERKLGRAGLELPLADQIRGALSAGLTGYTYLNG